MGEDAGVYEELRQLKFNVEVLRKTGWSGLVQKPLISLRRTICMIDNRSPISNWVYRKKDPSNFELSNTSSEYNLHSDIPCIVTTYEQNAQIQIYFRDRLIYYYFQFIFYITRRVLMN
jgi:hypothetical protein